MLWNLSSNLHNCVGVGTFYKIAYDLKSDTKWNECILKVSQARIDRNSDSVKDLICTKYYPVFTL